MTRKEAVVARVDELQDGEMKQVSVEDTEVLLARVTGKYYAMGVYCTHYGAPLAEGALSGAHVVCPWHHACFSVMTGNQEEPPGSDSLPHFAVRVSGEDILVSVTNDTPAQRRPTMVKRDPQTDSRVFAILGAGAAGGAAVERLRQVGFQSRIILITAETRLPYDRTALSKVYLAEDQKNIGSLRDLSFYEQYDVEILMGKPVARVDTVAQRIDFVDGDPLPYDTLLVATGGVPRRPNVLGADLEGVYTLRTPEDADSIIAAAKPGARGMIIGASFIGMECAASLRKREAAVTVVAPESVPFEFTLGKEVGGMYKTLHETHGVTFALGTEVEQIEGKDKVEKVVLRNGRELSADFAILGVGIRPETEFLRGVARNEDGSVTVDSYLRVEGQNRALYAAGDIETFPDPLSGEPIRIEHWRLAQQHGRVAAANMAGAEQRFDQVPFFWTRQYDQSLKYVGHVRSWDSWSKENSESTIS